MPLKWAAALVYKLSVELGRGGGGDQATLAEPPESGFSMQRKGSQPGVQEAANHSREQQVGQQHPTASDTLGDPQSESASPGDADTDKV